MINQDASGVMDGADGDDPEFHLRGAAGALAIDGRGVARLSGVTPRMYIYDRLRGWQNVEVTFYARRVEEFAFKSSQGFVVGARSEHQDADDNPCNARTYYGRILYDGRVNFIKELWHDEANREFVYTVPYPKDHKVRWDPPNPELPRGEWIGVKFVVRNVAGTQVRLELYRDRSRGMGSGVWEQLINRDDTGNWTANSPCAHPAGQVFTEPATSVFIRNDFLVAAEYARFSIREIAPV